MDHRLRLDLHLDAFGLVDGGAWTLYDRDGNLVAEHAYPGLGDARMHADTACDQLLDLFQRDRLVVGHQLRIF